MDTDLVVLARRVAQLERVLGVPENQSSGAATALAELRASEKRLNAIVPDELVSAHRAVRNLREAVTGLRSFDAYRRARAESAEKVVDDAVTGLQEMEALQESIHGAAYGIDEVVKAAPDIVALEGFATEVVGAIIGEEERIENLLVEYNNAMANMNCRILRMAAIVRRLEEAKEAASGGSL